MSPNGKAHPAPAGGWLEGDQQLETGTVHQRIILTLN